MKNIYWSLLSNLSAKLSLLLILAFIINCGPKPKETATNIPFNLSATTKTNGATLSWQINRTSEPIGGYNIYLAESPEDPGKLYNSGAYPGDTDGDKSRESIELANLENGIEYYIYLKIIYSDNTESDASEKISFMPLAKGNIRLSFNHTAIKSGYSFAEDKYTIVRDFANDVYVSHVDSKPIIGSPSRIHPSLRATGIFNAADSTGEIQYFRYLTEARTYRLHTADNGNALLTFKGMHGAGSNKQAKFDYIYYPPGSNIR